MGRARASYVLCRLYRSAAVCTAGGSKHIRCFLGRKGGPQAAGGEAEVHLCNADGLYRIEDDWGLGVGGTMKKRLDYSFGPQGSFDVGHIALEFENIRFIQDAVHFLV